MARDYLIKLKEYGISDNEYRYLKALCERYDEMKVELANCYELQVHHNDMNVSTSGMSDMTSDKALKATDLSKKCEAIEQSAVETSPECYQELIKGVTKKIAYEGLDIPYSKAQYYRIRRKFFYNLSKRHNI